jgi:hypothetical protein
MGVSATRAGTSQLPTELPGKGARGKVAEGETQEYLGELPRTKPLGAPFLAPGEQLGIVPPCPTLARRAASGAPSPLLFPGAKLKVMMPAPCPVSPTSRHTKV